MNHFYQLQQFRMTLHFTAQLRSSSCSALEVCCDLDYYHRLQFIAVEGGARNVLERQVNDIKDQHNSDSVSLPVGKQESGS